MKIMLIILCVCAVTACQTAPMDPAHLALAQQQLAQTTLEIDCPTGCSIKYRDPRDQLQLPRQTTGADVGIAAMQSLERVLMGGIPVFGLTYLGSKGFKALQGSGAVTTTTTDASTITSTDNSIDYSGNRGRIGSSDDYTHTPLVIPQPAPVIVTQPAPLVVQPQVVIP